MRCLPFVMLAAAACSGDDGVGPGGDGSTQVDAAPADAPGPAGPVVVYVADYGTRIHVFALDRATLAMTAIGETTTAAGPSFLAFDPQRRWLVSAAEGADTIESFAIAPATGLLTRVDGASSQGDGPAHVAVDATGAWVLVANYGGGTAAALPIAADGALGTAASTVTPGANAHQIVVDASNQVAYVPCLGVDRVAVFGFDATSGALSARTPVTAPGDGPRHLALARDGAHAWVMNELDSTVTTYTVGAGGALTAGATVSSLPPDFNGGNSGAEIAVHPTGPWVYASNRGHNSIAVFEVGAGGALTLIANTSTGGNTPRHFSLLPGGGAMLVANQGSGTIHGFRIAPATGLLTAVGELARVSSPAFVGAIALDP